LVDVLGFDIGGANTKAAYLHEKNGEVTVKVASQYFPFWKGSEKLSKVLNDLTVQLGINKLDALAVTMTAELSDAYQTKSEGVLDIISQVEGSFNAPLYVLNSDAQLISSREAKEQPLMVASANWAATGWLISQQLKNAVVVDIGSTSTSIIPIINGKVAAIGKTDLDKLIFGELVYTGSLRTNLSSIVHSVPIKSGVAAVSSELFSTSGDIHLILGNLSSADFTSETADGRGKTLKKARARLARLVCADIDMLSQKELKDLAQYIWEAQITQISEDLQKVYQYTKSRISGRVPVVVTGLGKDFLACKAAQKIDADSIIDLAALLPKQAVLATPAVGVALMGANEISEVPVKWP
jgi:(4-(4-[2-(gamma-L-glutamylamino)ethyl]phenoxymethyl)furan-2-yl)methanamine synthase